MSATLRSELLKVRTTRGVWAYVIAIVALAALGVAGQIGTADWYDRLQLDWQLGVLDTAGVAGLMAVVFGIMVTTSEFRHGTITPTFLATPARLRVLTAKAATSVAVSLVFALLAFAVVYAIAVPWLSLEEGDMMLFGREALQRVLQIVLATVLLALLGTALGAVVHSQVAALVGTLVWLLIVESLLGGLFSLLDVPSLVAYLPFVAIDGVDGGDGRDNILDFWNALAVALGYVAVIGALGVERTRRRDIT